MLRILCIPVLALSLSACVSMNSIREDLSQKYIGKDAEVAVSALGIPDREINAAGRKAYVWEVGQGDCTLRMEVKDEKVVDVRVSGYIETCNGYTKK